MPESLPPLSHPANCNSILEALSISSKVAGLGAPALEDASGAKLNHLKLWLRIHLLGGTLNSYLTHAPRVGVLLPSSVAAAVTFYSLHHVKRVPVMLNFSAGKAANLSAIKTTQLDCIVTSTIFIEKAKLENLVASLSEKVTIIYLEDLKKNISKLSALIAIGRMLLGPPDSWIPRVNPEDAAVILFTSGSEGSPKGVALSHKNLLSNLAQVAAHLDFSPTDKLFNALPIFHSFGLTVGTLLPTILGFQTYFYPSPLQYKIIPTLIKKTQATIFLSTDTFLRGYANQASTEDLSSLRLVVAGAEKLKESTRELYQTRFNIDVIQGYGVTETSPVAAANTPSDNIANSVGKLLPYMEYQIKPVEGIPDGGELWLKGPNVMLGYMKEQNPGQLEPAGEWYNTGDVVRMDAQGHIFIIGRLKRFAKIGGEMVSLSLIEEIASHASPEAQHAAVAISDDKKGEQIILITEDESLKRPALIKAAKQKNAPELGLPKKIIYAQVPVLGNGKINYMEAKKIAEAPSD